VYAPSGGDARPATSSPGAATAHAGTTHAASAGVAERQRQRAVGCPSNVGELPLMQLYDPLYSFAVGGTSTAPVAASAPYSARPPLSRSALTTPSSSSSDGMLRFTVTVSSVAFELTGSLEAVEGTLSLVDIGGGGLGGPHGVRRRLSEDMHFTWQREAEPGGGSASRPPITGVFTLPAAAATPGVRALIQLTHLTPAAGGLDPKVYTQKDPKKAAAHLAKEKKRLEKPIPPGGDPV